VFVGSVNLDPRSLEQNTEVGVLVRCPELAGEVAELFERWASPAMAYEVRPAGGRTLEWVGTRNGHPVHFTGEPEAGFWRPLGARFFSHLPIDAFI
jgi:putative cardiolipin synthase